MVFSSLAASRCCGADHPLVPAVRICAAASHEVGSHGFDHKSALKQSHRDFIASVEQNGAFFRSALPGVQLDSFAYPFGTVTPRAKLAVRSRFRLGRGLGQVMNGAWLDQTQVRVCGLEACRRRDRDIARLVEEAARRKRWLLLCMHDASDSPSDWGCTRRELDDIIRAALGCGMKILPFREALPA